MKLKAVYSLFILFLFSCTNGNEEDSLLTQPPYNSITDSIRQLPDRADLYYKRGMLLLQNNEPGLAEADLKRAWDLDGSEDHAIGVANVLTKRNQDSAIAFIEQAVTKLPNSIILQVSLARGYQQKKNYEGALAVCNNIINQFPNQIDALLLKAELLKSLRRNKEALQTLEQAYTYAPFDAELSYNLAFEYAEDENAKALVIADSLIKMDSSKSHAEPYYIKGVYYANKGNTTQALAFFNQAIQHDYYFLDAYMEKGSLLYDQKRYSEALQTFQLAAKVSPTFADAYFWLGKIQEAMNKKPEAKDNYQRAYSLDKSLTEAKVAADRLK